MAREYIFHRLNIPSRLFYELSGLMRFKWRIVSETIFHKSRRITSLLVDVAVYIAFMIFILTVVKIIFGIGQDNYGYFEQLLGEIMLVFSATVLGISAWLAYALTIDRVPFSTTITASTYSCMAWGPIAIFGNWMKVFVVPVQDYGFIYFISLTHYLTWLMIYVSTIWAINRKERREDWFLKSLIMVLIQTTIGLISEFYILKPILI